jgi:hypothetical protein
MSVATTVADLEDELSNMLHHLYRLGELRRWQLSQVPGQQLNRKGFGERLRCGSDDLRAAGAQCGYGTMTHGTSPPLRPPRCHRRQ